VVGGRSDDSVKRGGGELGGLAPPNSPFGSPFDPQIEWTEPAEYPGGGTYHGHAGVKAHLSQSRGTWAEGSCEPERFIVAGEKIIVFVYVRVRLKHNKEWHEGRLSDVYTFRGKAIQMRAFADRRQALEWAGVKASDAN
jgi:uncharacterized protein